MLRYWLIALSLHSTIFIPSAGAESRCAAYINKKVQGAQKGWSQFRTELKEQGPIRLVLAPRTEGRKFNSSAALMDPFIDLPIEMYSLLRWRVFRGDPVRKRLSVFTSLPLSLVTWGVALWLIDLQAEKWSGSGLEGAVSADEYGAAYVAEWVLSGSMDLNAAVAFLRYEQDQFTRGLRPLHERVGQYVKLGWWSADQGVKAEAALAKWPARYKASDLLQQTRLNDALEKDPALSEIKKQLPENLRFTWDLLALPPVKVFDRTDAEWLGQFFVSAPLTEDGVKGLRSLNGIYQKHKADFSWATLAKLVAETLSMNLDAKKTLAAKLGLDAGNDFIYRADIPLFSGTETFTDLQSDVSVEGELGRWNLILHDARFAPILEQWRSGGISELEALLQTEMQIRALGSLNAIHRLEADRLTPASACKLIYGGGDGSPANPIFSSIQQIRLDTELTDEQTKLLPTLQFDLAATYYAVFTQSELHPEQHDDLFEQGSIAEKALYTDFLKGTLKPLGLQGCSN